MQRHLFSFDPGDANNGFCYFRYDTDKKIADVRIMEVVDGNGLEDRLKLIWGISQTKVDVELHFVIENFRIDGHVRNKVFQWNEVITVRNIGKVEMVAKWLGGKLIIQEPSELALARKWSPIKVAKGHLRDDHSALLHGIRYMMKMKWINTEDQVIFNGQERF